MEGGRREFGHWTEFSMDVRPLSLSSKAIIISRGSDLYGLELSWSMPGLIWRVTNLLISPLWCYNHIPETPFLLHVPMLWLHSSQQSLLAVPLLSWACLAIAWAHAFSAPVEHTVANVHVGPVTLSELQLIARLQSSVLQKEMPVLEDEFHWLHYFFQFLS